MTVEALLNNERWIQGPDFLKQPEEEWPQRPTDMGKISPDDPEVKKTAEAFASETSEQTEDYISKTFQRFSSWTRLKRVVAWILRYKGMLRRQSQLRKENKKIYFQSSKGEIVPLTVCEIRDAEEVIIKHVQNQSFKEDMQTLRRVTQETQDKKIAVKSVAISTNLIRLWKMASYELEDVSTMHQSRSTQDTLLFFQRSITLSTSLLITITELLGTQELNTPYHYSDKATG